MLKSTTKWGLIKGYGDVLPVEQNGATYLFEVIVGARSTKIEHLSAIVCNRAAGILHSTTFFPF
jgi:hypothetical protein